MRPVLLALAWFVLALCLAGGASMAAPGVPGDVGALGLAFVCGAAFRGVL